MAHELVGEVAGRAVVVVDDMIGTGAAIEAAVGVLRGRGAVEVSGAATHGVLAPGATEPLASLGAGYLLTDTLRPPDPANRARGLLEVCTAAPFHARRDILPRRSGGLHEGCPSATSPQAMSEPWPAPRREAGQRVADQATGLVGHLVDGLAVRDLRQGPGVQRLDEDAPVGLAHDHVAGEEHADLRLGAEGLARQGVGCRRRRSRSGPSPCRAWLASWPGRRSR